VKIIYFVKNGQPTANDLLLKSLLTKSGNKVTFSNGSVPYGFEDSCGKVVMSESFQHVEDWCARAGIECSVGEASVDIEDAEFVEVAEEDEESELREKYFQLFGKKAGNKKLENIKLAIEEAEQDEAEIEGE